MDIGTSKPTPAQRAEVRHHLLDLVEPDEEFTVTQFQAAAREALRSIADRGHHALLVGGTGLYLRAVVDDLQFPGRYPEVKAALETELDEGGVEVPALHARLAALDPRAATRMEPTNRRRVVRALEVTLGSGQPFSTFGPGLEAYPPTPVAMVGVTRSNEEVDRRIAERFARWIEGGLLQEVRALAERPRGISRTARQALGYRELLAHVEEGAPLVDCVDEAVRRTRSFARRQASWFRRDPRIVWTDPEVGPIALLDRLLGADDPLAREAHEQRAQRAHDQPS
jgi:tRNA dimethylallyltransferase